MYDIPELEKKWRKYRRNKIKKPILITSLVVLLGAGAAFGINNYLAKSDNATATNEKQVVNSEKSAVANTQKSANPSVVATTQKNNQQAKNDQAMVITRVNNNANVNTNSNGGNSLVNVQPTKSQGSIVIDPIKEDAQSANNIDISKAEIIKPNVPDDEIRVIGFDNKEKKKITKKYEDILVPSKSQENIKNREKIAELEEHFKSYQDPKDSLALAKIYYSKGNYAKAESWAVNTNNIDGDLEESWLIFAKSRVKQGFRKDAIKVLQSYYDETNSVKAKALLKKIRFGKPF